jgi:hypothetical protein
MAGMRVQLLSAALALSVLAGCGEPEWRDQDRVWNRPGDAALIGSPAFRRELLRSVSRWREGRERWGGGGPVAPDITDRFLQQDTARFCLIGAREKAGHRAWQVLSVLPPNTPEGWARWVLADAALSDDCGLRLFLRVKNGKAQFTAVYDLLDPGKAARRRIISNPEATLTVIVAPKGPATTFSERAARLAGARVPPENAPDPSNFWVEDGTEALVASDEHRRALLHYLASRAPYLDPAVEGMAELPPDTGLAPLCAMPASEKAGFQALDHIRLSREGIERVNKALAETCHLRIFRQSSQGLTRLVAIYEIDGRGDAPALPRLRKGAVSLDVLVLRPAAAADAPASRCCSPGP